MTPSPHAHGQIVLSEQAHAALIAHARASHSRERGGVLVGYRENNNIHVHDALKVHDKTAGLTKYLRRRRDGQAVLNAYLAHANPDLGYVGEWHTHPRPAPPSVTDHAAMRSTAITSKRPVCMIVPSLHLNRTTVDLHGVISEPRAGLARLRATIRTAQITTDGNLA